MMPMRLFAVVGAAPALMAATARSDVVLTGAMAVGEAWAQCALDDDGPPQEAMQSTLWSPGLPGGTVEASAFCESGFDASESMAYASLSIEFLGSRHVRIGASAIADVRNNGAAHAASAYAQGFGSLQFDIPEGELWAWSLPFAQFLGPAASTIHAILYSVTAVEAVYLLLTDPDQNPTNNAGVIGAGRYQFIVQVISPDQLPSPHGMISAYGAFDLALTPVPTPTVVALLGLGALAVARRRR